ncbi:hemerythrin domain-containing protein [Phycicoccus duodecadis]|uniref:Hemerythrin HHE cation binding domain-containing protein n=1 Tax=Phycicoccus duodecadis TaxID=173053 RepID=A0A2N3YJE9_9MICO|nr:hemerythrin domain-containing protein [Phycicoccus duodecadis]PKW26976.1 hemerythrin HHE cation binding domain-containing protein [Phycicoccus duodecadis]
MAEHPEQAASEQRALALGAELRALHGRLRASLDDALAGVDPTAALLDVTAEPVNRCRAFCSVLAAHQRREDATLFPWLLAHRPDLAPVLTRLDEDHRLVAGLLGELTVALDAGAAPSVLVRHLEGLDAVMESHFRYEERELLPAIAHLIATAGAP